MSRRAPRILFVSVFAAAQALGPVALGQTAPAPYPSAPPAPAEAPAPAPAPAAPDGVAPAVPAPAPRKLDKATLEEARQTYKQGELAYQSGDYATAVTHFKAAQELVPSPHAAFWLGMAFKGASQVPEAIAELKTLLASAAASKIGEEKLAEARAALEALEKVPAKLGLTTEPPGASVTIDGQPGPDVTPLTLDLAPGTHVIQVALKGYHSIELELQTPPGTKGEQALNLEAIPPPPVAAVPVTPVDEEPAPVLAPPPPAPRNLAPAYVLFGLAGASAITGTVFGVMSLGSKSDYDAAPSNDRADTVDRDTLATDLAFGAAITFGLAGLAVLVAPTGEADRERPVATSASRSRLDVTPYGTRHGGGASARVSF